MSNNKIKPFYKKKIEDINNVLDLNILMIEILTRKGLSKVKSISQELIIAVNESRLHNDNVGFFLTLSRLNNKAPSIKARISQGIKKLKDHQNIVIDELYIVTSNSKLSDYFQGWIKNQLGIQRLNFWAMDDLVSLIDKHYKEFWNNDDLFLNKYEEIFILSLKEETELKRFSQLKEQYQRALDIFIEPKLYTYKEDPETGNYARKVVKIEKLLDTGNYIISGDAGTGKSSLLKEIGKRIIKRNQTQVQKLIPVYIKASDLLKNNFNILDTLDSIFQNINSEFNCTKTLGKYSVILLIDSIDGFESDKQTGISNDLLNLQEKYNTRFILCTRNADTLGKACTFKNYQDIKLVNFDVRQVRKYIQSFFRFDESESDKLWNILKENNTLEKIPPTPLIISLISILYAEKGHEIPATITKVFAHFSLFLLNKETIDTRLHFLDITIKKRILSIYALEIINTTNNKKKTEQEFIKFVTKFFASKSININDIPTSYIIKSLTDGIGVLYIDENNYVAFKHDYFMEYYASLEIFNQHRHTYEETLINNFTKFNWQNTAIFYAGQTNDMPKFLSKLLNRAKTYRSFHDCLVAISGIGYILQALWMTDSGIRTKGVLIALELIIFLDSEFKKLGSKGFPLFKDFKSHDFAIMNLVWFHKHFNSLVMKSPLELAYINLETELQKLENTSFPSDRKTILYKLFCIAATLNSRNSNEEFLMRIFRDDILKDPFFVTMFDKGLDILDTRNKKELDKKFKIKARNKKYKPVIDLYIKTPTDDLIFTSANAITPLKKVEIFTEGRSDAQIIRHAFSVLTEGREDPIWKISSCEDAFKSNSGGASKLAKLLKKHARNTSSEYDITKTIIGIFDNDSKGCQEFGGFDKNIFHFIDNRTKKHKNLNIYALKIPIPVKEGFRPYHQEQQYRLFELEHYFSKELLARYSMIKESPVKDTFRIADKKTKFAGQIIKETDPSIFQNFVYLFNEIDTILGIKINYIE